MIKRETVLVTPEQATRWLDKNVRNRRMELDRVRAIASDILAGRWEKRNVSVAFYADGILADGQHRLQAVVNAGVAVEMEIETGYPDGTAFDDNRPRTWSDNATIAGEKNSNCLSAMIRQLYAYSTGMGPKIPKLSNGEMDGILVRLPDLRIAAAASKALPRRLKCATLGTLHLLLGMCDSAARNEFFEQLKTGQGVATDPVLLLRNRLFSMTDRQWQGFAANPHPLFNSVAESWVATRQGKKRLRAVVCLIGNTFEEIPGVPRSAVMRSFADVIGNKTTNKSQKTSATD